ncbi:glycine cleavage system protein GcvH [Candidatus Borrarchaeum sp.]|uniref:glycine cleavage system protein H n=1 Tax=Candidatus Borrarchaeum sp. TaxID=2846742 RepID=UPI0025796EAC|nr:glycine cleavage system protein GcvH [Candidatus Borrarchaeum sp.]
MGKLEDYELPDDLYYTTEHSWAKVEGDSVVVGVTDFAQAMAEKIQAVQLPFEGESVEFMKPFGTLESGKWTGKIYAPVSGEVTAFNEGLWDDASLVNKDPYSAGWMIKITPSNLDEDLSKLMKGGTDEFVQWQLAEIERVKKEVEESKKE